jgi:N-acetylated-alpha-linked acidic dipeptidase
MGEERALLNEDGLPGRPWFRHLIYAPLPSYDAETLPGLREALAAGNLEAARNEAKRIGESLDRARAQLGTN